MRAVRELRAAGREGGVRAVCSGVKMTLRRRCCGIVAVWARRCSSAGAAWERRGSGVKVASGLSGRRGRVALARVATVWGRRAGGVEAVLGQCEDGMGVMQGLHLR